jgi:hypothetical protein
MSRVLRRLSGGGTGGAFVPGTVSPPADRILFSNVVVPAQDDLDLFLSAATCANVYAGGSLEFEIPAEATGRVDLRPYVPIRVDNRNNQISSFNNAHGSTLITRFRFFVWVSRSAINVTPKVYNISTLADASTTGAVACSTTTEDYSGANQQQSVTLNLPNSESVFKAQLEIGGSPVKGDGVRGFALWDCYVALP